MDHPTPGTAPSSAPESEASPVRRPPYVLFAVTVVVLAALAVLATARLSGGSENAVDDADLGFSGTVLTEPWERPDFTLTTTEGEPFHFAEETAGQLTLLFFGYTSCPDICPVHLATVAGALQQGGVPRAKVVFVGVDPARDTPEVVRAYLDRFSTEFVGLVGTPEELEAAQLAAGVPVAIIEPDEDGSGDYLVGHASQIIAYTDDDLAHVVYPFGMRRQDWVQDLPRLHAMDWEAHDRAS